MIPKNQIENDLELFELFSNITLTDVMKVLAVFHRIKTVLPDYASEVVALRAQVAALEQELSACRIP